MKKNKKISRRRAEKIKRNLVGFWYTDKRTGFVAQAVYGRQSYGEFLRRAARKYPSRLLAEVVRVFLENTPVAERLYDENIVFVGLGDVYPAQSWYEAMWHIAWTSGEESTMFLMPNTKDLMGRKPPYWVKNK